MLVTIIGVLVVIALLGHKLDQKLEDVRYNIQSEIRATDKNYQINKRKQEEGYIFHRVNGVEGVIKVNGKVYKTFNSGGLEVSGEKGNVSIELWVTLDGCFLGDIYMNGVSVREGMPNLSSPEEEVKYLTGLFNKAWSAGAISADTAQGAKEVLRDFQKFAYLLAEGTIAAIPTEPDYVWMGEIKARD